MEIFLLLFTYFETLWVQKTGEKCVMKSFSICPPQQIPYLYKSMILFSFFLKEIYCTRLYTACTRMRYKIVPVTNFNTCHH